MGRKSRVNSPYVRSNRKNRPETGGLMRKLTELAGLTERPSVEQLERRQMLFSLSIPADSVDPNTGIGTVTTAFGYAIPYLNTNFQFNPQPNEVITEPFDDEPPGPVGSGQFYIESAIQALHNILPVADFAIQPGDADVQDRWMRIASNTVGEFFAFRFFDDADNPQRRILARGVTFTIVPDGVADNSGLLPDNYRIDLIANNQVIDSLTGDEIRAVIQPVGNGNNVDLGVGNFVIAAPTEFPGFDTIRMSVITQVTTTPAFRLDNLAYSVPAGNFTGLVQPRLFGAILVLSGPVGATVVVEDLYGRDMIDTLGVDVPEGGTVPLIDGDDNGIPNFNDGIGRVRILNGDSRTNFTMWGATIEEATDEAPDNVWSLGGYQAWDGQFAAIPADITGTFDDFESAGFGYAYRLQGTQLTITGLPPGPGSVIIGSPFVRPLNNYNPLGAAPGAANPVLTGFTNPNQGVFVEGGSMGSVVVHGIVHGNSHFDGAADRVNMTYLVGSLTVEGDLGSLITATDAGMWAPDPQFQPPPGVEVDEVNKTGGQLVVGRTVNEIAIGGRSLLDVTVIGDLNSPSTRPPRDIYTYYEKEFVYGINTNTDEDAFLRQIISSGAVGARSPQDLFRSGDQGNVFGVDHFMRNNSVSGAEFLGGPATGIRILGELSGQDPINAEDAADVYAFVVDGSQDLVIEGTNDLTQVSPYFRIMDADGRTLASPQLPVTSGRFSTTQLRWRPSAAGVYYLVVSDPNGNDTGVGNSAYTLNITGIAPTTLGAYRTAGGSGFTDFTSGEGNTISVLNGNIGSVRVGVGRVGADGDEVEPLDSYNTTQTLDNSLSFEGGTFSTPGSVYSIFTGSDIGSPGGRTGATVIFRIGGDLGSLITGQAEVVGRGVNQGDVNFFDVETGGRIGTIDIRGGVGMDQDETDPRARIGIDSVRFRTGRAGGDGSIGFFRTGFHVGGDTMEIETSPGSTIGAFLTSQDAYDDGDDRSGIYLGETGVAITTGQGSDVRFVDLMRRDEFGVPDVLLPLIGDEPLEIVDDGGARITITVDNAPPDIQVGTVRVFPIDGSQGVAIGQISVDLTGGRILRIQPTGQGGGGAAQGVVGIGRVVLTGSDATSEIQINGGVEVDIYRIIDVGGGGLNELVNTTTGGDFVAVDIGTVNRVQVFGDLGQTQWTPFGTYNYAPFLGLAAGNGEGVGGALGVGGGPGVYDDDWNSGIFRPIADDNFDAGNAYLDDIGGPLDGWLNGLVVRTGTVQEIDVQGAVGDIVLSDPAGRLEQLIVNSDRITAFGRFEGIVGTIFANDVGRLDIGDGVRNSLDGPLASGGIFVLDDIDEIASGRTSGIVISSPIMSANIQDPDPDQTDLPQDGLKLVTLRGAQVIDAHIGVQNLDGFWSSFNFTEENLSTGDVERIDLNGGTFFRSTLRARDVDDFTLTNAWFDASDFLASGNIDNVSVFGFRNSTLDGEQLEIRSSRFIGARDLERLTVVTDISDTTIDILGSVSSGINAANITRSQINVDNEVRSLALTGSLRGSAIDVGAIPSLTVAGSILSSTIQASARINSVTVSDAIVSTTISVTGPDGSIGTVTSRNGISGAFNASGPIGTITTTTGDLDISVNTTTSRGNVQTLNAARDLVLRGDISGNVGSITAGRNLGRQGQPGTFLVRGDLQSASAPNGQLFADLRVGGAIVGAITLGGGINKPGQVALGQGSIVAFRNIASVTVNGDFDGDITSFSGGIGTITINNGSFLAGNTIAAYDGSIASISITNGNLLGSIHADFDLTSVRVAGAADGVFGHVGVNPDRSAFISYDARRNQLPVGVAADPGVQGGRISAGRNIVNVSVTGSVFESAFVAGRAITSITIGGGVRNDSLTTGIGSFFAGGESVDSIAITGDMANAQIIAGVVNFGADNRPGGIGTNADTLRSGNVTRVSVGGVTSDSKVTAGINAGADGVYNTPDDRVETGLSTIGTLALTTIGPGFSVYGDILSPTVANDNRFFRAGPGLPNVNTDIDNSQGTPGTQFTGTRTFAYSGADVTITFAGAGQAFFNTGTGRLTLRNTSSASTVTVASSTGTIDNFDIVTNDDASLGTLTVQATLTGDSDVVIDGAVNTATFGRVAGAGTIIFGADSGSATFASLEGGYLTGRVLQTIRINGDFGNANPAIANEASVSVLSAATINITGTARATISADTTIGTLTIGTRAERATFRAGTSIQSITSGPLSRVFVSAGDSIGAITVSGEAFDTAIMSGFDLGRDAAFGGTGANADRLSTGTIAGVTVNGNFRESDITAGYDRGVDGFFGTTDDVLASGRSSIGAVTISGTQVGSSRGSESYRIASTGTAGAVRVGGQTVTGPIGNFRVDTPMLAPLPVQVSEIRPSSNGGQWTANIVFNQPINQGTLSASLSVSEVRGVGDTFVRLAEGVDYSLAYNAQANTAIVTFSRSVTSADQPQVPGVPGPGVYRFEFDQAIFRAKLDGQLIDGDGNGIVQPGEDFSSDAIVGDAGDKTTGGQATTGGTANYTVNFYPPVNLDLVLGNNTTGDGLPEINNTFTIRGNIGDHPDASNAFFSLGSDVDLYTITLQAGQIVRLGALSGAAQRAGLTIFDPNGQGSGGIVASDTLVSLPVAQGTVRDLTFPTAYLVKQTGTYLIGVGQLGEIDNVNDVPNIPTPPGGVGEYSFTLQVFDDGDTGFSSTTNAGNGQAVVNAPAPISFAGPDGVFGTPDDPAQIVVGSFTFTLNRGADGLPNTADDLVSGDNGAGITSTRDGTGRLTSSIAASIGTAGNSGIPDTVEADIDVFHLNNRQAIAPGTKMRVTVKLNSLGADLGSAKAPEGGQGQQRTFVDERGSVQFGFFETSTSGGIDDGSLVFSPTDFTPIGGAPSDTIADNGSTKYGFDANGDYFIEFVVPDAQDTPGGAGTFAVYLQGVFNTDYGIEVVTQGTGANTSNRQNVLIETAGGVVDWLEVGGRTTTITPFDARSLGFTGTLNSGENVQDYIVGQLVAQLNALFRGSSGGLSGLDVVFSNNPADFEGEVFSTVFLSSDVDPKTPIFDPFTGFNFNFLSQQFVNTQPYGFSEHSDPFNTDLEDEAAVFVPPFVLLGFTPSQADIDAFAQSLTGAVSRRVGELMGLRISENNGQGAGTYDPFAADSVENRPGPGLAFSLPTQSRFLSEAVDTVDRTNFFLGQQNARSLLDRVLNNI